MNIKFRYFSNTQIEEFFFLPDDGICSFQEVKNFYDKFVGVPKDQLDKVAKEGYRALTAVIFVKCFLKFYRSFLEIYAIAALSTVFSGLTYSQFESRSIDLFET